MLILQNLNLSYNQKQIFSNLSLSLYPGTIAIIRGSNGSGKTSLLKIISGLTKADSGNIFYKESNYNYQLLKNRNLINYISHNNTVKDKLTIFENIEFWTKIYGSYELIFAAMRYFNLTDYIDILAEETSAGVKQRVELTRLMLKPSKIWLLDEPENNLDKKSKSLLNNLIISKSSQEGAIIVIASHNDYKIENSIEIEIGDFKKITQF